jgi:hypothetical protein
LLALAALLWLRLPTNGVQILNVDEADFAVEAGVLLDGGRPYVDFVEKKPPLIYLVYAGALALVGRHNLPAFRLLLIGYVFASALMLAAIARRLYGQRVALLVAPLYAVTVSVGLPMDVHAANAETLFLLPLLVGTYFSLGSTNRPVVAGVCVGLAALIKQQAGIQLPILIAAAWREHDRWRRLRQLCAGFSAPWAAAVIGLAVVGSLGGFLYWTIAVNGYYVANGNTLSSSLRLGAGALRLMFGFAPGVWVAGAARLVYELVNREARRPLVALWAFGSLLPIALGGRFFPHYFLQLFPPLVLLASAGAVGLWGATAQRPRLRLAGGFAAALLLVVRPAASMSAFHDAEVLSAPHAVPAARAIAGYVREHTPPSAPVLFWGYGSALYYLSQRRPATRFPYVTYLVGAVEGTPSWWSPFHPSRPLEIPRAWTLFFEDLERHPPALFIDTAPPGYFGFYKFPAARYQRLQAYLEEHYDRHEVAGFPVWSRRPDRVEIPLRQP